MSLAFQNADTIKQAIFEELQNLLSSEKEVLNSAQERMKQLEYTDGYGVYLAEIVMNQSFDFPLRQLACIMLTRYVEQHWCEVDAEGFTIEAGGIATDHAKRTIRNILPNGLYDPNSKIRRSVAHAINAIATTDWPAVWTELFDITIKCLGGNEDSIHGAMEVLQEFNYDEKQIQDLGHVVLREIYRIFESEQNYTIKTRTLCITILKTLLSSIACNVLNKQEQATMLTSILNIFMDKLVYYLSMNSGNASNFKLRIEIVKLFAMLAFDMPRHIQPYMDRILPVIWQLLTQVADVYVKVEVNQTEASPFAIANGGDDSDEQGNFNAMILQILEFVQCVITSGKFREVIKNVLTDLIYITIVYMQMTEDQIRAWNDDPEKFVEEEDDAGIDMTIRLSGQYILQTLNGDYSTKDAAALQEALGRHMNVAEAEKTAGNPHWWKIQEACLVAVNELPNYQLNLQDYVTFVRGLLNYQDCPYLVGRALWILSTLVGSEFLNVGMLDEILNETTRCLAAENPIVLKISAVRSINGYVEELSKNDSDSSKRGLLRNKLPAFVDGIINLVPGSTPAVLGLIIEALTEIIQFDEQFAASIQNKVVPLGIAVFLKFPEDPFMLEIVQEMIKALCQIASCRVTVQEKFIPTLVSIFGLQGDQIDTARQDIALDMLTTIVKNSEAPLSNILIDQAFPAMINCVLHSDDNAIMVSGGECMRSYISISPEQVCAFENGKGLNYVMELTTMLLNPMHNEVTAGQIGRLVITIITKMGNLLGENIDLLLKAVISKMQLVESLRVMMSLVVVFAHLILTEMDAVLNFLYTVPGPTGQPAIHFVFNNWLTKQSCFYGSYERKVTTMALCKLFEFGVTSEDQRLTSITINEPAPIESSTSSRPRTRSQTQHSQQFVTIPALVKIFKLLITELSHIKEGKNANTSGCDFDDDDDENDDEGGENYKNSSKSQFVSDLYFGDQDEDNSDDDQLISELMQSPLLMTDLQQSLTNFLRSFASNAHFAEFVTHLQDSEKAILRTIQVEVP